MLSPRKSQLLKKFLPHLLVWLVGGGIYVILERGILGQSAFYPSTGNEYDFEKSAISVFVIGITGGLIFGSLEEFLFKNLLRRKAFGIKLLFKTVLYASILVLLLIVITSLFNSHYLDVAPLHRRNMTSTLNFITNFAFFGIVVFSSTFIALSLFISEIMDHIGVNAITNFFTGKYSNSKVEERIFMFLDMRSSTTIAEKLGHESYYRLLNSYYDDMTDAIIDTAGEIYQYVGDEIVISWRYHSGIRDNNCINCFFKIERRLEERTEYYQEKFGLVPQFKAGLHYGEVSTGEVGRIKKEILFTGDVLNTAARIQSLCNELEADLLISTDLLDALSLSKEYKKDHKGNFELRGRNKKIELFSITNT